MNETGEATDKYGLADEEYILNETKISRFLNLTYNQTRGLLFPKNYEFYFDMRDMDDNIIIVNGTNVVKGSYPTSSATTVVPVKRYAMYNESIAKINFIVWL